MDAKFIRQSTNGGRALNAIWQSSLPALQKLILLYLGSQLDFNGTFTEYRWCYVSTIEKATSISNRTIFSILSDLEKNGYISREKQFEGKKQLATLYAINDKIFDEYAAILVAKNNEAPPTPHCDSRSTPTATAAVPPLREPQYPTARAADITPSPSLPPKKTPLFNISVKTETSQVAAKKGDKLKARKALSLVYSPSEKAEAINGKKRFYDQNAVSEASEVMLEKYGIDTVLGLRDLAIKDEQCGMAQFDFNTLDAMCRRINNNLKKANGAKT